MCWIFLVHCYGGSRIGFSGGLDSFRRLYATLAYVKTQKQT